MPRLDGVWRLVSEMQSGDELFKNDIDILQDGFVSGDPDVPDIHSSIVEAFRDMLTETFYPDVTLISQKLYEIYYKEPGPPFPVHPPLAEATYAIVGTGNVTFGGAHNANFLPADVTIYLKKTTNGGRNGKMFMRNILTEVDVTSALAGSWTFSPGAGHYQPTVQQGIITSLMGDGFSAGPGMGGYHYAVTHLENIPTTDARTPFATVMNDLLIIRPAWNKAHR